MTVDLADRSEITLTFTESPRKFFFSYDPALQGIGLAAEFVEQSGTYDQHESARQLTLRGNPGNSHTYNYTLSSAFLTLRDTANFTRCTNGSCQSGTRTVTIMARRK